MAAPTEYEGEMFWKIHSLERECKTWYKIVGELHGEKKPLVVLHGGPGAAHDYLLSLAELAHRHAIPVVFYDQIGNGRSTHLPETAGDESFWEEELFLHELELLIAHLKLDETGYHLFGQSWGGMLASSFAAESPPGLRRLILANAPADINLWRESIAKLRSELPATVQEAITHAEETRDFKSAAYQAAVEVFYRKHLCLVEPWPAPEVASAIHWLTQDPTVYATMNGPSELTLSGSLADWTALDRLERITAPTLVYNGDRDEAQDLCVAPFFEKIPKVRWVTLENAGHFTHVDQKEKTLALVSNFLAADT